MNKLQQSLDNKLAQWDRESVQSAQRAMREGRKAHLVQYPTGLLRMRFAEPFADYGMHYEVPVEVWESISLTSAPR